MATIDEKFTCQKCGKTMAADNFYLYKSGDHTELCKKCLTLHIDNYDPNTFLWLLQKMDVPYLPAEWNVLRDKAFAKDPNKMNGMSVFGKYLSKMKLKQWNSYSWADTEKLQTKEAERKAAAGGSSAAYEAALKAQFENGEISEAQYRTLVSAETQHNEYMEMPPQIITPDFNAYNEDDFIDKSILPKPGDALTQEDKIYLAMKWGALYKPDEWVSLEKNYKEMTESFDIQDADTINTLILLCKTNLKANQAIDCGDYDGYQKLARVQESLRKSAKFTAAQNKEQKNDYVDSVGELVAMCEKDGGFIPRYATDIPQDKVDLTLKDMKGYLYKLVTQDLGFGQQIEDSIRKIQIQKEMNEAETRAEETGEVEELEDEDYQEFYEEARRQRELDDDIEEDED